MPIDSLPEAKSPSMTDKRHTALVLLTNGTTDPEGLAVLEEVDGWMRRRFPDAVLCWAFSSSRILGVLQDRGLAVRSLPQTLAHLARHGFAAAVVQPLSVATTGEAVAAAGDLKVRTGPPLLGVPTAVAALVDILAARIDVAEPTVVAAHGSEHDVGAQQRLQTLAEMLEARFPRLVVASLRGGPGTAPLSRLRELVQEQGHVHIVPLLLTIGHHVRTDILGGHPRSWRHLLGGDVRCSEPLGRNPAVLELFAGQIEATRQRVIKELELL
ncbi:sirohydrochlorin cobaltochelatase [Desulfuromonas sp. AOP6]|uniref:sirohydrochlorin cobaltochelatase n=1 Tax=Desulfuromonas sp. AOP6 TaxID=1566351 RepID=UPI001289731A|nr:sirohydrochlorin cobaltochelatase [Desulfuromonas sp. AOP6]BCA79078.1 hypothetical protein AOP6_0865 [Desulfuromonas sp. AOP6]